MNDVLITANRLKDGTVVWLDADLCWREERAYAAQFTDQSLPTARTSAARDNENNEVTAIYEIPVNGMADTSARERIRSRGGPTIQPITDARKPTASEGG